MKYRTSVRIFAIFCALCTGILTAQAVVTINFNAGNLYEQDGKTLMPVGGLLELIADTSGNGFSAPTSTAFLPAGSDDLILMSFALNGNLDGDGTTQNSLQYDPTNATKYPNLAAGQQIELRWFPLLTTSSNAPGTGTNSQYGQFRIDVNQNGSNLTPPWTEPANNLTRTLNFLTVGESGANAESVGTANLAVPEPSTMVVGCVAVAACVGLQVLRRTRKA